MRDLKEISRFLFKIPRMIGELNMPIEETDVLQDIRHIIHEWKEYKDLEQQGKLLKLPCAVGDTVYVIPSSENFGINIVNGHEENNRVYDQIVDYIEVRRRGYLLSTCGGMACVIEEFYKKTWFTDKNESEVKLRELERYWKKVFQENTKV